MQTTQAATRRLADRTSTNVRDLWAAHQAGQITRAVFRARAAAAVAAANVAGVALADLGLAAEVTRTLRTPTPPLGLEPTGVQVDQDRIVHDIDSMIERSEDPEALLGDWAASEPYLTVATTVQEGMRRYGFPGWTRQLSGTSCPMCVGWADGVIRSVDVPMVRHLGCDCIQQPVF